MLQELPLAQKAAEQLIHYILHHNLQDGDKLPNEFELANLLGVGRSTVREAVKSLVSRNVLEVRQGAGTFVVGAQRGVAQDPLGFTFIQDKQKLTMDLLEVRMAIEPRFAAAAAMQATGEDVVQLQRLAAEVEQCIHAGVDHMAKDIAFHTKIAQSSNNLVAPNLVPIIQHAVTLFIDVTNSQLRQETIDTHRAIVHAIAAKDPIAASDAMTLHLIHNRANLTNLFEQQDK